jgi:uracil-DNA glycosylase family 4
MTNDKRTRLLVLAEEVAACHGCDLAKTRTQTVFARGNPEASIVLVGEAPGENEDEQGTPFVGKAGRLLDAALTEAGLNPPADVYIANVVKCRPPNNRKPADGEIAACSSFLARQLEIVDPTCVVALGATAAGEFGVTEGITRARGKWILRKGAAVMPTLHPAYVARVPIARKDLVADLRAVAERFGVSRRRETEEVR